MVLNPFSIFKFFDFYMMPVIQRKNHDSPEILITLFIQPLFPSLPHRLILAPGSSEKTQCATLRLASSFGNGGLAQTQTNGSQMNRTTRTFGFLLEVIFMASLSSHAETSENPQKHPSPLCRKDCFFGLHFDLHPQKTDTSLGADLSDDNVRRLMEQVRPDYVQYDCKGHPGYTGYPTEVGWASPGIVQDSLALWRKVTREYGVGLYIHYSGVWDAVAIQHHPDWARVDAEGKTDPHHTSTFGPYVDELLIPQLKEATQKYDLDGFWVDGECWGAQWDYSPKALEAWQKETGLEEAPKGREDPHWLKWKHFHRKQFERYLCHWVDALHAFDPDLQITSNWAYTTFMPKPVVAELDYLSGDYSPTVSVDRARVEARYLANTGMPWDLLAWGFNWHQGYGHDWKTACQLEQEAGVVLMQGGGFSIYYQPTRSGYVPDPIIDVTGEVAAFCRERKELSHKSQGIPQVALLLSSETQWDRSDAVFTPYGCVDELEGALHALLELHYSVDILAEHQLLPRLSEFGLVVVPDAYRLAESFQEALLNYVKKGGSLLLLGQQCGRLFASSSGVELVGEPVSVRAELASRGGVSSANGVWQSVKLQGAEAAGTRHPTRDALKEGELAATVNKVGKGKIGVVWGPVALAYFKTHHVPMKTFLGDLAEKLFPDPAVKVDAPSTVDLSLRTTADGRPCLHFLNLAGAQRADRFLSVDAIPAVGPLTVEWRRKQKPRRVTWEPAGEELDWDWKDGILEVEVPRLEIHGILLLYG